MKAGEAHGTYTYISFDDVESSRDLCSTSSYSSRKASLPNVSEL